MNSAFQLCENYVGHQTQFNYRSLFCKEYTIYR